MKNVSTNDKLEILKPAIYQLYSKEGRSKVYISKLLQVNRKKLADKISEWNLPEAEPMRYLKPSNQKFLNKHKNLIKSRLDNDIAIREISTELKVSDDYLKRTIIKNDKVLSKAYEDYKNRRREDTKKRKQEIIEKSSYEYNIIDYEGEIWKPIKGYDGYMVSNYGRVKSYSSSYGQYHLLTPAPNKNNGRLYISIAKNKKQHNLQVARLVGFSFVEGHTQEKNTINYKDGDVLNNKWTNLEWCAQSENNKHSYDTLNRKKNKSKRYQFSKILYKNKYEFKTVAAFSKFIGKSETQARRYLDAPKEHDIKLIA